MIASRERGDSQRPPLVLLMNKRVARRLTTSTNRRHATHTRVKFPAVYFKFLFLHSAGRSATKPKTLYFLETLILGTGGWVAASDVAYTVVSLCSGRRFALALLQPVT